MASSQRKLRSLPGLQWCASTARFVIRLVAMGLFPFGKHAVSTVSATPDNSGDYDPQWEIAMNRMEWAFVAHGIMLAITGKFGPHDCGSGGRWFESTQLYQEIKHLAEHTVIPSGLLRSMSGRGHTGPSCPIARPALREARWWRRLAARAWEWSRPRSPPAGSARRPGGLFANGSRIGRRSAGQA